MIISGCAKQDVNSRKSTPPDSLVFMRGEASYTTEQVDIAAEFLPDLLSAVDDEGVKLLLFHLEPLFTCPQTRLHAFTHLFDMFAQWLGQQSTEKIFLKCLVSLFDSHVLENYEVIVRQSFLSQIIVRFGLDVFLNNFITFVVDAVAFKSKLISAADKVESLSVHSSDEVTAATPAPEMNYSLKNDSLDMDDDSVPPRSFLGEADEDHDDKIGRFSMTMDDLENDVKERNLAMNVQYVDEGSSVCEKEDEIVEQVTLLPRQITDEEGDARLYLGNISDDENENTEVDGGHSSKMISFDSIHDGLEVGGEVVDDLPINKDSKYPSDPENIEVLSMQEIVFEGTSSSWAFESTGKEQNGEELENSRGERKERVVPQSNPEVQICETTGVEDGEIEMSQERRDHAKFVDTASGDGGMFKRYDRQLHDDAADDFNVSLENENVASEGVGLGYEESSSDGESHDNELSERENPGGDIQSGDNMSKGVLPASPIKTFFDDTKSKSLEQIKTGNEHRNELTPAAISAIAAESIVWLAPRLGPVLTSKYVVSRLLTMLPHCYTGRVGSDDDDYDEKVVDDHNAKWLLFALSNFCTLYGEAFFLYQYLPFIEKTVSILIVIDICFTRSEQVG